MMKDYHCYLIYRPEQGYFYRNAIAGDPPGEPDYLGPFRYPRQAADAWCERFVRPRHPSRERFWLDVAISAQTAGELEARRVDREVRDFLTDRDLVYQAV